MCNVIWTKPHRNHSSQIKNEQILNVLRYTNINRPQRHKLMAEPRVLWTCNYDMATFKDFFLFWKKR